MEFQYNECEPQKVWYYFGELSKIPRGSGNTKAVSDYCVAFAKEHNLWVRQDESNNVIIKKGGSKGRENEIPVILQGHLDMVAEKTADSTHDFTKEPLKLLREGDLVYAEGTTLGGDDGIAIAYSLAILADEDLSHPPIEALFTVDEEVGMLGAKALDMSDMEGKYVLNLDSEEEGILLAGCAGGMTGICSLPLTMEKREGVLLEVEISGLLGGHSGVEIQKEHCNAAKLFGRLLTNILEKTDVYLVEAEIGLKDNAIPRSGKALLLAEAKDCNLIEEIVRETEATGRKEYYVADPGLTITVNVKTFHSEHSKVGRIEVLNEDSTRKVAAFLVLSPNGIYYWHPSIPGLVQTSLNLGIFSVKEGEMSGSFSIRSSADSRKKEISQRLRVLMSTLGGTYSVAGDYPGWEYKEESKLRPLMETIYEEMYGEKPKVETIHAGLECGYLMEKKPDLDIVSFGPNIYDIHTTEERISIASVERTYRYVLEILKRID